MASHEEPAALEELAARMIRHCERAFDGSAFFRALAAGAVEPALMRHVFVQYRSFRDQLHRWFGLCIMKAPSCRDPSHKAAILALADHIFTDLRDAHEEMYDSFLRALGVEAPETTRPRPGGAADRYTRSFLDDFGSDAQGLFVALAALGGRELCVALRNQRLIGQYFLPRGIEPPAWIALHAHLEADHFRDAIRPVLLGCLGGASVPAVLERAVERAVDQHVRLFDDLLREHQA
jgi:hypothetical protein